LDLLTGFEDTEEVDGDGGEEQGVLSETSITGSNLRSEIAIFVNCSLTKIGKVQRVILTRTDSGEWDVSLYVDCGSPDLMVLSRMSQTHMFFLPETQAKIKSLISVLHELNDE
jgi:hypothetical protein